MNRQYLIITSSERITVRLKRAGLNYIEVDNMDDIMSIIGPFVEDKGTLIILDSGEYERQASKIKQDTMNNQILIYRDDFNSPYARTAELPSIMGSSEDAEKLEALLKTFRFHLV